MNILARAREVMSKPELTQEDVERYFEEGFINPLSVKILSSELSDEIDDELFKILTKEVDLK